MLYEVITVKRGEFVGIIGKSGAGKSTLVNMLTGVDILTSGSVTVNSVSVHNLSENQRNTWRGRHVGIVYQSFELLNQLTVLEMVEVRGDHPSFGAHARFNEERT